MRLETRRVVDALVLLVRLGGLTRGRGRCRRRGLGRGFDHSGSDAVGSGVVDGSGCERIGLGAALSLRDRIGRRGRFLRRSREVEDKASTAAIAVRPERACFTVYVIRIGQPIGYPSWPQDLPRAVTEPRWMEL